MGKSRILMVDDETEMRKFYADLRSVLPFDVDIAGGALEALALIQTADAASDPYKVILLDINMPYMDGIDAAVAIKYQYTNKRPALIALTANNLQSLLEHNALEHFDDYITKPFNINNLIEKVKSYIQQ